MEDIKKNDAPKAVTKDALKAELEAKEAENAALKAELDALKAKEAENGKPAAAEAKTPAVRKAAKVKIKLPLTRTEKDDVLVGLNGKTYLIKRGVEVEVPVGVAKILQRKEKMLAIAMEFEAQASAPLDELAKMYQ